jgi:hypothetical protein
MLTLIHLLEANTLIYLILATGEATTIKLPRSMAACPCISYGPG